MILKRLANLMLLVACSALPACAADNGDSVAASAYRQQLSAARANYFKDIQGDRQADIEARKQFALLSEEHPSDPVVEVYSGSLELLEAARTWAIWNKHTLAQQGLAKMDRAVAMAPGNLEAHYIRGATTWHLPFFFHRKQQAESDFSIIAPKAEAAARQGTLPSPLAASALDYYGQILAEKNDESGAKQAFEAALRVDPNSPAGKDAAHRLH
jgi:tetratricopeptide (TPR) repeat protein